ncbi:MAG: hypothetical protein IJS50_01530 [Desulfovibrio sp.]|nr:hypothetical protein [Desulfovibrio sp.]
MEIETQHMEELLRIQNQQAAQNTRSQNANNPAQFESLLAEALNSQNGSQAASLDGVVSPRTEQAAMISQMLLNPIDQNNGQATDSEIVQYAFDSASGTLDLWDSYTRTIRTSSDHNSLRDAYSILESIGSQVEQLKTNTASLKNPAPGLNSIINQLDVMATTERVKFNRGDYA